MISRPAAWGQAAFQTMGNVSRLSCETLDRWQVGGGGGVGWGISPGATEHSHLQAQSQSLGYFSFRFHHASTVVVCFLQSSTCSRTDGIIRLCCVMLLLRIMLIECQLELNAVLKLTTSGWGLKAKLCSCFISKVRSIFVLFCSVHQCACSPSPYVTHAFFYSFWTWKHFYIWCNASSSWCRQGKKQRTKRGENNYSSRNMLLIGCLSV
jgi:hypothetical protein